MLTIHFSKRTKLLYLLGDSNPGPLLWMSTKTVFYELGSALIPHSRACERLWERLQQLIVSKGNALKTEQSVDRVYFVEGFTAAVLHLSCKGSNRVFTWKKFNTSEWQIVYQTCFRELFQTLPLTRHKLVIRQNISATYELLMLHSNFFTVSSANVFYN